MLSTALRTMVPILMLIGVGAASRKIGILKAGDTRVLSAYVYYFALPALLLVNIAETQFDAKTLRFMAAGVTPVLIVFVFYFIISRVFSFSRNTTYVLTLSTIFGSWGFFGIPFVMFAFPTREAEKLATLSLVSIAIVSVTISITLLEYYRLERTTIWQGFLTVTKKLSKNPLIIAIVLGLAMALLRIKIPSLVLTPLHMLGSTTATIAIFLLGAFLYGRKYANLAQALKLSLLKVIFLPAIAFLTVGFFDLSEPHRSVIVLMHAMPLALSMIVLSERYDFNKETFASLILITSIAAGIYLNLWLLVLGHP
ncbi:MAG: AEC family transporter [candidate division WOR-3 bacterium]|nr:AEC family transporter [candidate division WOR-3 bacterium]